MLVNENFLDTLIRGNQMSPKIAGKLFTYDEVQNTIKILPDPQARVYFKLRYIMFLLIAGQTMCRLADSKLNKEYKPYMGNRMVETSLCLVWFVGSLLIGERYKIRGSRPEDYTSFVNGAISTELKQDEGVQYKVLRKAKGAKFIFFLTYLCCKWAFAVFVAGSCILDTDIPFNVLWFLERSIKLSSYLNLILHKIITFVVNYFVWEMVAVQSFCLPTEITIGVLSISYGQEIAYRKLSNKFKNSERRSKFYNDGESYLHSLIEELALFRSIHILVKLYNRAIGTLLFMALLVSGAGQIVFSTTLILQKPSDNVPILLNGFFMVVCIYATLVILAMYGFAADVNAESADFLSKLKRQKKKLTGNSNEQRRQRKFKEKFVASCQVEKIQFGMSNFIEKATPPTFQLYCINRIVDLLLVHE